ncbi:MAG: hypothetical protein H0W88_07175 [Parachlamydiaceae bacterium]|nr:hypothetical protein [Parachlamydiaceae bacterium]
MIKASHTTLITISGVIWLGIGCFLLSLGLNFLVASILQENLATTSRPIIDNIAPYIGGLDTAVIVLICLGLFIGYTKGKYIFAKTVQKGVNRIKSLPNPVSISQIYTKKYYILLGAMFLIGFVVKFAPLDVRGLVDVAIGSALINGAVLYFRNAYQVYRGENQVATK